MSISEQNNHEVPLKESLEPSACTIGETAVAPAAPCTAGESGTDLNEMQEAYEATFRNISEGEVVEGTVISITDNNDVMVDVGYKSEGIIPLAEFRDESGQVHIQPGDKVSVFLEQAEDSRGHIVLSHEKAKRMRVWDEIERAYREQSVVTGRVIERIKGGLAVDIGVRAFLPGSQIDLRPVQNLDSLRGKDLRMRVIKVNKKRGNIVLSRKSVLEEDLARERQHTLEMIEENKTVDGTVKNITDYGVFVDLGGIDGLLHITDISWGKVSHPEEIFHKGDRIKVKVIKFDRAEGRVSLGYKQLSDDPWVLVPIKYPRGTRVKGRVVNLADYGAFVEIEPGVEGLVHITEMTWNKRIKHPSKIVNVGDIIEAAVLDVQASERKISLGLKQIEPNPWTIIREKYPVGSVVTGRVRNITNFGAFVEIEDGIDGLVHISDLSWTKRVKHPSEILKKGERVNVKVLEVDPENQKLSLGIKQLEPDKWEDFFLRHSIGDILTGKVMRVTIFGIFVEVAEGVEGLCHISEVDWPKEGNVKKQEKLEELFIAGQQVEMKIIKLIPEEKKIGLSTRGLKEDRDRSEAKAYMASSESGGATLQDHLGGHLREITQANEQEKK
ncbi:MAG: 30S ribosomal protein S1 [Acidobacteria bacterium]|nr:30S ribosomal protein S1 [Acidobacteriota bacterium]